MATLIDSVPAHVSPDEHKALVGSTPVSFTDIPPVLRWKEELVAVSLDPPLDGWCDEHGKEGTLYVLESALVFMSNTGHGFQVPYTAITLHAISRAQTGPSIYCQLDNGGQPYAEDDADAEMKEMTIVPKLESSLEPIFESISLCASLHPDPNLDDDMGDNDDDEAFISANGFEFFNGDEDQELSQVGRVRSDFTVDTRFKPY